MIEYVEQQVTALVMMYSPTVNDTQYPLGTATTCPADRYACADLVTKKHVGSGNEIGRLQYSQVWSILVPRVFVPLDKRSKNARFWEQPFQACAIDADSAVKPDGQNSVIVLLFQNGCSQSLWERDCLQYNLVLMIIYGDTKEHSFLLSVEMELTEQGTLLAGLLGNIVYSQNPKNNLQ